MSNPESKIQRQWQPKNEDQKKTKQTNKQKTKKQTNKKYKQKTPPPPNN